MDIRIAIASHCKSTIGKLKGKNGKSYVEFDEAICDNRDIYHELLHTVGLIHEHQRGDRDEYVKFNQNNLQDPRRNKNFKKLRTLYYIPGLPYNFKSVMHYFHDQSAKSGLCSFEIVNETVNY